MTRRRGEVCAECGEVHTKCLAHVKASNPERADRRGKACKNDPSPGCEVCWRHGAKASQVAAAGERRELRRRAEGEFGKLLAEIGDTVATPEILEGLPQAYERAWRTETALRILVAELPTPLGENRFGERVTHPLVALHGEWLDRVVRIGKIAIDAGLDVRKQKLAEADIAELLSGVVRAVAKAGLTDDQQEALLNALADEFDSPQD